MIRRTALAMAFLCLPAIAQEPPAPCAIGGTVTDETTGQPVARARVIAQAETYSLLRLTSESGAFCFDKLAAGEYHVIFQKAGYGEATHPAILAVEPDSPLKPIAVRLTRDAALSGTVVDSGGQSLPGAQVTLYQRQRGKGATEPDEVESTFSDTRGAFHFSAPPGTYYLSVKEPDNQHRDYSIPFADARGQILREHDVETFYAGSFTFADATPIELQAGEEHNNLAVTLQKARLRRIAGHVPNPSGKAFLTFEGETETGSGADGVIPVARDGSFVKIDLPPARYTLRLRVGPKLIARKLVDLTLGDALDLTLDPLETRNVPVTLRTEGKGPKIHLDPGCCFLLRNGSEDSALEASGEGGYRFADIERGTYRLAVDLGEQRLYLKSIGYGGQAQSADQIDLSSDRPGGLELTFSANVAEVRGKVSSESEDLTVILVDESRTNDAVKIAGEAGTDQKGRFRLTGLAPGKYRLFAIEGFDAGAWGKPELARLLESKSLELDCKENDKKQVSLPAISASEWEAAVKKAGS